MLSTKILEIISGNLENKIDSKQLSLDDDLSKYNINSLTYIKIIVALEEEFDIEFDDDELDIKSFKTIGDFVKYTVDLIDNK